MARKILSELAAIATACLFLPFMAGQISKHACWQQAGARSGTARFADGWLLQSGLQ